MNKRELVSQLAAGTPVTKADAERLVGVVFSAIAYALARAETVTIAGFGKFVKRSRVARTGRNPQTMEPIIHPATSAAVARRAAFDSRSAGAETFVAGRAPGSSFHSSRVQIHARSLAHSVYLSPRRFSCANIKNATSDKTTLSSAAVEAQTLPDCLRRATTHRPRSRATITHPHHQPNPKTTITHQTGLVPSRTVHNLTPNAADHAIA